MDFWHSGCLSLPLFVAPGSLDPSLEVPQCRLSTDRPSMSSDGNGFLASQIWYEYAGVAAARKPAFVPFWAACTCRTLISNELSITQSVCHGGCRLFSPHVSGICGT